MAPVLPQKPPPSPSFWSPSSPCSPWGPLSLTHTSSRYLHPPSPTHPGVHPRIPELLVNYLHTLPASSQPIKTLAS